MEWSDRIGRRLKLRDLHILMGVAQEGSMAKAAKTLSVSQPVVSKAIADLEHAIGARLVDRFPHGVELTVYGSALLKRGLAAFDELRLGVKDVEFLTDPTVGEVRIAATEPMSCGLLPAIMGGMWRRYPGVTFQIEATDNNMRDYPELRARKVDVVLGRIVVPMSDDQFQAEVLFDDPLYIVAGVGHPFAKRRKVSLAELINEKWILPPSDSWTGQLLSKAFGIKGLPLPRSAVVSPSLHLLDELLATSRFLGILSNSVLRFSRRRRELKVLPVDFPFEPRPTGLVTLKNRTLGPVALSFIECARELGRLGPAPLET